jgi:hypothetical protein
MESHKKADYGRQNCSQISWKPFYELLYNKGRIAMAYMNPTRGMSDLSCRKEEQTHVHEILGSVEIAERQTDPHNHRFATVSGQAIPVCGCSGDHVHEVMFRTDFYEDHFHEFCGKTCGAIPVGDRHVHFLESVTTVNEGHRHEFRVATLINDPIGDPMHDCHDCNER